MADESFLRRLVTDIEIGFAFLTRVPLPHRATEELSAALWTAPLVGVVVGFVGSGIYWLAQALHLPPLPAAVLAVAATALVTGCLHEDGLADVADGFGGGATRERKLDIMRDSRIGTYGVCALIVSFMLRAAALTNLGDPALVAAALVTAHAAGRAPLPAFMRLVAPARADGLSADAGRPPVSTAVVGLLLGLVALLMVFGFATSAAAILLLAIAFGALSLLSKRQIGGQTGDVLGALEQVSESIVLLVAVAATNTLR